MNRHEYSERNRLRVDSSKEDIGAVKKGGDVVRQVLAALHLRLAPEKLATGQLDLEGFDFLGLQVPVKLVEGVFTIFRNIEMKKNACERQPSMPREFDGVQHRYQPAN